MSVNYKVENIEISAIRDRAMFNTFANNQSYIIKDIGDELAASYSANSFNVSLGNGEAVICGGSMLSSGVADVITLGQNESGYIVIEIDLSQTGSNICRFTSVSSLTQQNINDGNEYVYDLPLYQYTTDTNGVQNMVDIRNILQRPIVNTNQIFNEQGTSFDNILNALLSNKQDKLVIEDISDSISIRNASISSMMSLNKCYKYGNIVALQVQINTYCTSSTPLNSLSSCSVELVGAPKPLVVVYNSWTTSNKKVVVRFEPDGKMYTTNWETSAITQTIYPNLSVCYLTNE